MQCRYLGIQAFLQVLGVQGRHWCHQSSSHRCHLSHLKRQQITDVSVTTLIIIYFFIFFVRKFVSSTVIIWICSLRLPLDCNHSCFTFLLKLHPPLLSLICPFCDGVEILWKIKMLDEFQFIKQQKAFLCQILYFVVGRCCLATLFSLCRKCAPTTLLNLSILW